MHILAFSKLANTPGINPATGKPYRDATGAFQPSMDALFTRAYQLGHTTGERSLLNTPSETALRLAATSGTFDVVAFFCHGWPSGLELWRKRPLQELVDHLTRLTAPESRIALYGCWTAGQTKSVRDPFAFKLSRKMPDRYVLAHDCKGHSAWNPHKVMLRGGAIEWSYPSPMTHQWELLWKKAKTNAQGNPERFKDGSPKWVVRPEGFDASLIAKWNPSKFVISNGFGAPKIQ